MNKPYLLVQLREILPLSLASSVVRYLTSVEGGSVAFCSCARTCGFRGEFKGWPLGITRRLKLKSLELPVI